MSFHLSQTPTLEAVSTHDEQLLNEDLQTRVAEAVAEAQALPDVVAIMQVAHATSEELARLRTAERALHQLAKDSRTTLEQIGQQALDALVDAAAGGYRPEW
jgi:predicted nucleotidyltransferase